MWYYQKVATSPNGSGVAGEGLGVPGLWVSHGILKLAGAHVCSHAFVHACMHACVSIYRTQLTPGRVKECDQPAVQSGAAKTRHNREVILYFLNSVEENFKTLWKDNSSTFRNEGRVNSLQALKTQRQESASLLWEDVFAREKHVCEENYQWEGAFYHCSPSGSLTCFTEDRTHANRTGLSLPRESITLQLIIP